jgi:hypothetical protein
MRPRFLPLDLNLHAMARAELPSGNGVRRPPLINGARAPAPSNEGKGLPCPTSTKAHTLPAPPLYCASPSSSLSLSRVGDNMPPPLLISHSPFLDLLAGEAQARAQWWWRSWRRSSRLTLLGSMRAQKQASSVMAGCATVASIVLVSRAARWRRQALWASR